MSTEQYVVSIKEPYRSGESDMMQYMTTGGQKYVILPDRKAVAEFYSLVANKDIEIRGISCLVNAVNFSEYRKTLIDEEDNKPDDLELG